MSSLRALLAAVSAVAAGTAFGAGGNGVVLGYYPCWVGDEYPPEAVDFTPFTHVCHAFLSVSPNGDVAGGGTVPSVTLTGLGRRAGVKVLLSIGGAGSGAAFNPMARHPERVRRFLDGVMRMVEAGGYDGVDLDWEFPECEMDRDNLTSLAAQLRRELLRLGKGKRRYVLTAAVTSGDYYGRWHNARALARACDFLNVMTYDFAGDWGEIAGHNAPLEPSSKDPGKASLAGAMEYWNRTRGVPKRRLIVGIPCYGRGFDVGAPYEKLAKGATSKYAYLDYRDAVRLPAEGWTPWRDAETRVPWLFSPGGRTVFGYDDPESAGLKGKWARDNGYAGIFFWDMNADRMADGSHPVMEAAVAGWKGAAPRE